MPGVTHPLTFGSRTIGGQIDVRSYGASAGASAANNHSAIQGAIDAMYALGGGEVIFPEIYSINASLIVPQRVVLVGRAGSFINQFVTGSPAPKGGGLFLASGSNVDVLIFRCNLTNDAGVLMETIHGVRNSEARHFGGARDLVVWGNRSTNQAPGTTDLNSSGDGIKISGSRYVQLERVTSMYCAGDAIEMASHDYGTGALSSNNAKLQFVNTLSNAGHGMRLAGGDNIVISPNSGYNESSGIYWISSGTITGGLLWNNGKHGLLADSMTNTASASIVGVHAYDNDETGFRIGTGRAPSLAGCVARGNGRDTGAASTDRSNFLISSGAEGWSLAGCRSYARDQDDVLITQYGYRIVNSTYSGSIDGSTDEGSATPWSINDPTKIITHGGVSDPIAHPPVQSMGLKDGITAPGTVAGIAQLYVDSGDGDLKVKFGDGTVKTIVVDT